MKLQTTIVLCFITCGMVVSQDDNFTNVTISGKLKLNGGLDQSISNDHSPHIYRSVYNANNDYPFSQNGNLVLQPRTSLERDIVFLAGQGSPVPRMVIKHNGNIGIGTYGPTQKLQIFNELPFNNKMESENQDHISLVSNAVGMGGFFGGISWKSGGRRRAAIAAVQEHTDADYIGISFFTQGTDGDGPIYESMRISRDGNLGIGTDNPQDKLHVVGDVRFQRESGGQNYLQISSGSGGSYITTNDPGTNVKHLYLQVTPTSDNATDRHLFFRQGKKPVYSRRDYLFMVMAMWELVPRILRGTSLLLSGK
ncbi:hypothetical protein [Fulvivirga imtechensis]|nr:hypothetical protein [Fulvivirga imtechensis]